MTVSAAVRFSPVPPALRLIRNSGTSPLWKASMTTSRRRVRPVSLTLGMPRASSSSSISASISVNCENKRMRRPSATSSSSIVSSCSVLADSFTFFALGNLTSAGWQQVWRSLRRASSSSMRLLARPLPARSFFTFTSIDNRMLS